MPQFSYILKSGFDEMDFSRVTCMLKNSRWVAGIKKEEVVKGAQNSALVVGAFTSDGFQVGYARVISDKTRFGYILDVYVDENHRKKRVAQNMIKYILNHSELKDVYQWALKTQDAHSLYRKAGFHQLLKPEVWMEIRHERPDR
jgi:N-acetylglutamate synthase-like GNAT family acetyltransferase